MQPLPDPQQQVAMMSQFGLSAVVANMQSHFALLPKPFPWSVRTFPSLSSPSLPSAQCGMVGNITTRDSSDLELRLNCYLSL